MDKREPRIDGAITYVPVFNAGRLKLEAKLNTEDYQRLIDNGLTGRWYLNANQRVTVKHGRAYQQVSRLILGIDRTQWVQHKDKDPLNLLRNNLEAKRAGWPLSKRWEGVKKTLQVA
jgi:hypothetical protein